MDQFSGQQLLNDPMANIAMSYGQTLADQGTDYVHKNVSKVTRTEINSRFDDGYVHLCYKVAMFLCLPVCTPLILSNGKTDHDQIWHPNLSPVWPVRVGSLAPLSEAGTCEPLRCVGSGTASSASRYNRMGNV